jgi:hypothetical protein
MLTYGDSPDHSPERLLLAARTALMLMDTMRDLLAELFPDELLAITNEQRQEAREYLAMALADEAWPDSPDDYRPETWTDSHGPTRQR